jgi:hypothetical protein
MKNIVPIILLSLLITCFSGCEQGLNKGQTRSYKFHNFDWNDHPSQFADIAKPVSYEIQIASDKSFSNIIDQDTIALSRYVHDRPFDAGTYYWRIRSMTYDGEISGWSKTTAFTIKEAQEIITVSVPGGKEDCTDAIQSAVKQAEDLAAAGSSVKLVFPAGDYYFGEELQGALINLYDVKNIEIEGTGAKLHFSNRKQGLINAEKCENIAISGFDITNEKGIFRVQGRISKVDEKNRIIKVTLEKGSPSFDASSSIAQDVFILLDSEVDGHLKDKSSTFYRMDSYELNKDGSYTIQLNKGGDITDWEVGGRFVYHFRSGSTMYVDFPESKNVSAYKLTTDGWGGMGFVSKKGSNFNILHCNTMMQEGKWMMGNADGVHIREHVVGPWIEGTHIQGLGDDGLALYARPVAIASAKTNGQSNVALCDTVFFNFEKGDEVSFFEPTQGKILLETKVLDVQKQADGRYLVEFSDSLPDNMITGEELARVKANEPKKDGGWDAKANSSKLQDRTQIWNRSKSCGEFVIRNSKFTNIRRYGSVFRAKGGLIENNVYKSASSMAINFRNETAWPNGLYASEIIIRNNVIDDCGFDGNANQPVISFKFERRGGGIVQSIGARNLLIDGNTIIDCPSPAIGLEATSDVVIRNNRKQLDSGLFEAVRYKAVRSKGIIAGNFFTVDEAISGKAGAWSYTAREAGHYQVGQAWLEVLSEGSVELLVTAGGKVIRKDHVVRNAAVHRFECRIDELVEGETIQVSVKPSDGTQYRIGYMIAFATPTFPGARVFDVSDFGAKGDGTSDDMAAVHAAVDAAKKAGAGIVRFKTGKTYRVIGLKDMTQEYVFDLRGTKNIKIEGNGAKLLLHPPDGLTMVEHSENIQVDGFVVDYLPRPYYQGEVKSIDMDNMTCDIVVPERYPVPEIGKDESTLPIFGRTFIPDSPGTRTGDGNNIHIEEVTQTGNERELRVHFRKNAKGTHTPNAQMQMRVKRAYEEGVTELVVPHLKYGHRGGFTKIMHSSRIKLSNLHYNCVPYFWLTIQHNTGPVTLSNVDILNPQPATELYVSWRDGMHIKNGRWGTLIEDGDWDGAGMYDDTFAIYSRALKIVSQSDNTITITPNFMSKEPFLWKEGDWASIWTQKQEKLKGMARVIRVEDEDGKNFRVTLEALPEGAAPDDIVLHEESVNRGTLIRNCSTTDIGTEYSSTRFRCVGLTLENNDFEDFHFWFHPHWIGGQNGPRPRDIIMENNRISDNLDKANFDNALNCILRGNEFEGVTLNFSGSENILLEDNKWTGSDKKQLSIIAKKGSAIFLSEGNTLNGSAADLKESVKSDESSVIENNQNIN